MMQVLMVGAGGFVGAVARYGVSGLIRSITGGAFPLGTLAVNSIGCLIIGAVMGLVGLQQELSPNARLFLIMGLLGSFTTFSTFGYETITLAGEGDWRLAAFNVLSNVAIGLVAVTAGRTLVRLALA